MTGRIVYEPEQLHPCNPPRRHITEARAGTQWQCDDCWQIWNLEPDGSWRRNGNPHKRVELDGEYHVYPQLDDPFERPEREHDSSRPVAIALIAFVLIVIVIVGLIGHSEGWWVR